MSEGFLACICHGTSVRLAVRLQTVKFNMAMSMQLAKTSIVSDLTSQICVCALAYNGIMTKLKWGHNSMRAGDEKLIFNR